VTDSPGHGELDVPRDKEPSRDPDTDSRARLALITAVLGCVAALLAVIGVLIPLLIH
jgi:hypothetical protein